MSAIAADGYRRTNPATQIIDWSIGRRIEESNGLRKFDLKRTVGSRNIDRWRNQLRHVLWVRRRTRVVSGIAQRRLENEVGRSNTVEAAGRLYSTACSDAEYAKAVIAVGRPCPDITTIAHFLVSKLVDTISKDQLRAVVDKSYGRPASTVEKFYQITGFCLTCSLYRGVRRRNYNAIGLDVVGYSAQIQGSRINLAYQHISLKRVAAVYSTVVYAIAGGKGSSILKVVENAEGSGHIDVFRRNGNASNRDTQQLPATAVRTRVIAAAKGIDIPASKATGKVFNPNSILGRKLYKAERQDK